MWVSGVGSSGSKPQPFYSQLQLLLHLQKDIRVWEAVWVTPMKTWDGTAVRGLRRSGPQRT